MNLHGLHGDEECLGEFLIAHAFRRHPSHPALARGQRVHPGHLWFLVCLLGFSLVLLPGFAWLHRPAGRRLLERLGGPLARPGGLLLLALPLAVVEVALGSETGHGGWNNGSYALFLVYGYLAAADPRIGEAFQRRWRPAAALGLLLFLAAGAAYGAADAGGEPFTGMDARSMAFRLLKGVRRLAVGGGHRGPGPQPAPAPPKLAGATR
jgi:hypothetical protein